jgi:hypothetical protein
MIIKLKFRATKGEGKKDVAIIDLDKIRQFERKRKLRRISRLSPPLHSDPYQAHQPRQPPNPSSSRTSFETSLARSSFSSTSERTPSTCTMVDRIEAKYHDIDEPQVILISPDSTN